MTIREISGEEIRSSLRHGADRLVPPSGWANSLDDLLSRPARTRSLLSSPRRRWLAPAVSAAVTMCALLAVWAVAHPTATPSSTTAASGSGIFHVDGLRAVIDGLSLPIPVGWSASTFDEDDDRVTVCLSPTASTGGQCDGITVTAAIAEADGHFTPIQGPLDRDDECRWGMLLSTDPVAGRLANYYSIACAPDGPASLHWYLTDGSLLISTPAGRYAEQGQQIVQGLDLTGWHVTGGPTLAENTGLLPTR